MTTTTEHHPKVPQPKLIDGITYTGDKGPKFGARHVQVLMMGLGNAIAFASKSVLSIAIVAMTDSTASSNPDIPTYDWDNKSVVISSLLWSGIGFNLIAGYLGKRFGPKWFIIAAALLNSVSFLFIPLAAQTSGSTGVIVCRIFQGVALGFIYSLNSVVLGRWVPPEERSRLGFVGAGLTTVMVMIVSLATGYISSSYLGWPWIFYILGSTNLLWAACYAFIGAQSADVHPRISPQERLYIQTTLFRTNKDEPTPFYQIFTSIHVWAAVIGQAGYGWMVIMVSTEISIYLDQVLEYDLKTNGTISAIPALLGLVFGVVIAPLSDIIPKRGILSVLNSRRTFHLIGSIGNSLALIAMTFVPKEHRTWAVVILCIGNVFILGPAVGGSTVNLLDISPKFAGIIGGLGQTLSQSLSLFAPLTVQWICTDESDVYQWRIVFILSASIIAATGAFFAIFASGERQPWETESEQEAELEVKKRKSSMISMSLGLPA